MLYILQDLSGEPFATYSMVGSEELPTEFFDPVTRTLLKLSRLPVKIFMGDSWATVSCEGSAVVLDLDQAADRRKVDQRIVDDPDNGDCTRACIATLLGSDYADLPHLDVHDINVFWDTFVDIFEARGFDPIYREIKTEEEIPYGYCLVSGRSPRRDDLRHMVVYKDRKLWHDPHPSRSGLSSLIGCWALFTVDPSKAARSRFQLFRQPIL
jgi:hypothetical protein